MGPSWAPCYMPLPFWGVASHFGHTLRKFTQNTPSKGCDTYNTFFSRVVLCNYFALVDFSDHKNGYFNVLDVYDEILSVAFFWVSKHQSDKHNTVSKLIVRVFFT